MMEMKFSYGCFCFKNMEEKMAIMKQDIGVIRICCHFVLPFVFTVVCLEYLQFGGRMARSKLLHDCSYGQGERCASYQNKQRHLPFAECK